jgi:hypothetical protein
MKKQRTGISFIRLSLSLGAYVLVAAFCLSCGGQQDKAEQTVEQHLRAQGVQDVTFDLFHTDPNFPGKAYVSVTVTHPFASSKGSAQKEYLGFILKQEGQEWKIEQNTKYTKEANKATDLLAGRK